MILEEMMEVIDSGGSVDCRICRILLFQTTC